VSRRLPDLPDSATRVEAVSQYARPAPVRGAGVLQRARFLGRWLLPALLFAALLLPFVLRQNAWFEWGNYYWLVVKQTDTIRHLGHPSYFMSFEGSLFYPQYVFYGGTLWSAAAYVAIAGGSTWGSFLLFTLLALVMAFAGSSWLARQLGVSPVLAPLVGALVLTSPYYLGILYGRGAWSELIAVSAVPLVLASAIGVVKRPRLDPLPLVLLFGSTALIAGAHNITLFWGGLFCVAALALLGYIALREGQRPTLGRIAALAAAAGLGVLVNAWYLLPDAVYAHNTSTYPDGPHWIDVLIAFDRPGNLFYPWNHSPVKGSTLYTQVPLYTLLWSLAVGAVLVVRRKGAVRAGWLGALGLLVITLVLVSVHAIWRGLPLFFQAIQFPLRLDAYVILAVAGLAIASLIAVQRSAKPRPWLLALGAALLLQGGLAVGQAWGDTAHPHLGHRAIVQTHVPPSFQAYQQSMFRFTKPAPIAPRAAAKVEDHTRDDGYAVLSGSGSAGELYGTNIVYSPFIKATGDAQIAGRDGAGMAVVKTTRSGAWRAEVRAHHVGAMKAGMAISLLSLAAAAGGLLALVWWRRRT